MESSEMVEKAKANAEAERKDRWSGISIQRASLSILCNKADEQSF